MSAADRALEAMSSILQRYQEADQELADVVQDLDEMTQEVAEFGIQGLIDLIAQVRAELEEVVAHSDSLTTSLENASESLKAVKNHPPG